MEKPDRPERPERKVFGATTISTTATTTSSVIMWPPRNAESRDESSWWEVIDYEIEMYVKTRDKLSEPYVSEDRILRNAVVESLVVHARNLCTIFTSESRYPDDDILLNKITDLKPDSRRDDLIGKLKAAYGEVPPTGKRLPPKRQFNKGVLHVDTNRGKSYDYSGEIDAIHDLIVQIAETLETSRST